MALLSSRLDRLESQLPADRETGRVIRIIVTSEDDDQTRQLLDAEGFDPARGDFAIIRRIVSPPPRPTSVVA